MIRYVRRNIGQLEMVLKRETTLKIDQKEQIQEFRTYQKIPMSKMSY